MGALVPMLIFDIYHSFLFLPLNDDIATHTASAGRMVVSEGVGILGCGPITVYLPNPLITTRLFTGVLDYKRLMG